MTRWLSALLLIAIPGLSQTPYPQPSPSPLPELDYEVSLYPEGADHDPAVPSPEAFIEHPLGARTASPEQIAAYAGAVAEASERVELVEYARSYEDRPLLYLVISSPDNLARQDEIQAGMARLADPRELSGGERDRLIASLPAIAWMAYSIHGNETSGADAALAVIHHLAADRSEATRRLLAETVVIVDPSMNPDGRARFIKSIAETRGAHPDVDDQSLVHRGYWPFGRGNHYLFDLNRDWIYARHPETRGRIRHFSAWRPLLFVDAHEMGSQDTFLLSPAREPHNPHLPPYRLTWGEMFANDQARAFDTHGYPYYSGEWHEDWYPGYSDSWAALRGAQGILYEQARVAEYGVQRRSGLLSYRRAVHHQLLSTWSNLETLRANRERMLQAFAEDRAGVVGGDGPYAGRSFVVVTGENFGRRQELLDLIAIQGFEAYEVTDALRLRQATDQLGIDRRDVELPAGTLVLPNRQPEGRLLAAMFEFDPRLSEAALEKERQEVLKHGRSTIYDTTAWNVSMMFGVEAYTVAEELGRGLRRLQPTAAATVPPFAPNPRAIAYAVSGADDRAPALAGRLMERGVRVRANERDSELDGHPLPRGSVVVTRDDNRGHDDWESQLAAVASDLGLEVHAIGFGRAPGDLPDLGGRRFGLLAPPRIALLSRGGTNMLDFGAVWYVLDHRLGLRHSHLDEDWAAQADLRRYNVIYLPERWGDRPLPEDLAKPLAEWVRAGGTLVATGAAARALMQAEEPFVGTRELGQVIEEELDEYQAAIHREWLAASRPLPPAAAIWGHAAEADPRAPWTDAKELPKAAERKRQDAWRAPFMPSGAIVANRADPEHWLTAGVGELLPGLFSNSPVLMAAPPVEAPLRVGVYHEAETEARLAGWAPLPAGQELRVRMAGLLWPEARERIASSAWVTRERVGRGQVILFAHAPAFRAAQVGAIRVLENALVYGPGLGTDPPVQLP